MKEYIGTVRGDKYSTEYRVSASGWATASARIVKAWMQANGKGARTDKLVITIVVAGRVSHDWKPPEMPKRGKVKRGLLAVQEEADKRRGT
jgi:hypothetical protein